MKNLSRKPRSKATGQHGIVLLEALCGLLIFAVGILGLIGLQAASVKQAAAAEYRSAAALQANDLISRMWLSDRTAATLQAQFASPSGPAYLAWKAEYEGTHNLPAADVEANAPEVTFASMPGGGSTPTPSSLATITIRWQAPGDEQRMYTVLAQLK